MARRILIDIFLLLYIVLFVYAATSKLIEYKIFLVQLGQSPILTNYAGVLAWSVPSVELVTASLLIIPNTRRIGLHAAFSLMIMFTTYIIVASMFSDFVPCSCGGVLETLSWTEHLILNLVFVMIAPPTLLLIGKKEGSDHAPVGPVQKIKIFAA